MKILENLKPRLSANNFNKFKAIFINKKLTFRDILLSNKLELQVLTDLDEASINILVETCIDQLSKNEIKTTDTLIEPDKISSGCENFDLTIGGGFRTKCINEIFGSSGCGKTQICLVLSLTVQLESHYNNPNKGVVYICTEGPFPIVRLKQLEKHFQKKHQHSFTDNIFLQHLNDYASLHKCLNTITQLIRVRPIGLIVIDSIAGLYRGEEIDYFTRSQQLITIAVKLKELSEDYNIVIVVTNQVSENLEKGEIEPCLGLTWTNLVTNRYFVSRSNASSKRRLGITFSSYTKGGECDFFIEEYGINSKS